MALLAGAGYAALMGYFRYWWRRIPPPPSAAAHPVRFSVVVACRNEAQRIPPLLEALAQLDYPARDFEVVFVDDHSSDATARLIRSHAGKFPLRLLALPSGQSGKKAAVTYGVAHARHPLIVLTDADCIPHPQWLRTLAAYFSTAPLPALVAGPIRLRAGGLTGKILALEQWGLVGVGAASMRAGHPTMVNGGNMAFPRAAFDAVGGYARIDHFAAGDDELLAHRLAGCGPTHFAACPETVVATPAPATPARWWQQRRRWAAATAHYNRAFARYLSMGTAVFHVFMLASFAAALPTGQWLPPVLLAAGKVIGEVPFLYAVMRRWGAASLLKYYPLGFIYYLIYVPLITFHAIFGPKSYRWKGRKVR